MAIDKKDIQPESVRETIKETTELQSVLLDITDIYDQQAKELKENTRSWRDVTRESTTLNSLLYKTLEIQGRLGKEIVKRRSLQEQINKLENYANIVNEKANIIRSKFNDDQKKNYEEYIELKKREKDLAELVNEMSDKSYYSDQLKLQVKKNLLSISDEIGEKEKNNEIRSLNLLNLQKETAIKITGNLKDQNAQLDKINVNAKFLSDKLYITDQLSSTIGTKMRYFLNSLISGSGIVAVIILFKELLDYAFKIDNEITSIANNLGVTKDAAKAIRNEFTNISQNGTVYSKLLDKSLLTISNQVKALEELQEATGTATLFTEKQLQSQIFLTKQLKLSKESSEEISKLGLLNNQTGEDAVMIIAKQVALFDKEKGIRFSTRNIINQISKITGALIVQYKGSVDLLAKAVLEANKLGLSLEKTRSISEGFLDFETSIGDQLKAQLLSGKQINFEKVRQLALDGDSAAAAKEALKQMGTFNDFTKQNVIVRKALAESVNMTTDELSDSLRMQELLNKAGFENVQALKEAREAIKDKNALNQFDADLRAKTGSDILAQQVSQLSMQDKFNNSVEKLKEIFGTLLSGPFMGFLKGLVSIISNANVLKGILIAIGAVLAANAVRMTYMAIASAAANPIAAAAGLIAAGLTATFLASAASKISEVAKSEPVKDAVINPKGGIEISTPKGKIIPDKDDHLIATPEPEKILQRQNIVVTDTSKKERISDHIGEREENTSPTRSNSILNNKEKLTLNTKNLENKLDEMITLLKKGGHVYMDSKKVGTAQGMAYSAFA